MIYERTASLEEIGAASANGTLFALIDACDEPSVPATCRKMTEARAVSLYQGKAQEGYWHLAPYLAQIRSAELDWILSDLASRPWGYFVVAHAPLATLRKHFRKFLRVKLPDGKDVLFRFYDPRVLITYLKSCNDQEHVCFFGPVFAFVLAPNDESGTFPVWMRG